jgi:flagellar hook-associated protein FlgK
LILGKIQSLVGGQSLINSDGTATQIIGGLPLVERAIANKLVVTAIDNPVLKVQFTPANMNGGNGIQEVKSTLTGQAGALISLVKEFVPLVNQRLNTIAQGLVSLANNASGASAASSGALKIFGFTTDSGTYGDTRSTGGDITNQIPVTNSETTMASLYTANATDGLGLIAQGLTAANFVSLAPTSTSLYKDSSNVPFITSANANTVQQLSTLLGNSVASLVSDVGNQVATWGSNQKANQAILDNLNNQKNSVSGVNLDEEAANLLKFQQLYAASSKVLQVGNDMFRSILDIMN